MGIAATRGVALVLSLAAVGLSWVFARPAAGAG